MTEHTSTHQRKQSIPSPGLDALAAAAETSARMVSPSLNSPPPFQTTFVGAYGSTPMSSGLDQLGDAAASVSGEHETKTHTQTTQLKEATPGPEQELPDTAVPQPQSEQVQVKAEISESTPVPALPQQNVSLAFV